MATSQISKDISRAIRKRLHAAGVPHFQAAEWAGISPAKLSLRLSGGAEWRLTELNNFSEQVFGMPLVSLLEIATSPLKGMSENYG